MIPTENSRYSKQAVSGAFDRQAAFYAEGRGRLPWFQAQVAIALKMLELERGLILDIGCAAGAEIEPLRNRGFRIVGIDYSEDMLRFAHERYGASGGVDFCRADAESLPFASASVDHVVCLGVLEYLSTYERCLGEIHRVLRPGGVVIISIPTRISLHRFSECLVSLTAVPLWRTMKRLIGRRTSGQPIGERWNRCIPWQVRELLRKHGFKTEHSAYSGFLLFPIEDLWPAIQVRLFLFMEGFSDSRLFGWMLSQYLVGGRKTEPQ